MAYLFSSVSVGRDIEISVNGFSDTLPVYLSEFVTKILEFDASKHEGLF